MVLRVGVSGRIWGSFQMTAVRPFNLLLLCCLLIGGFITFSCGGGTDPIPSPSPPPHADPLALGTTLDDPYSAGDILVGSNGLQVQVIGILENAQPFLLESFPDNPPPPSGYRYYLINLRIFNLTNTESIRVSDDDFSLHGTASSPSTPMLGSCGSIPEPLEGEIPKGGQVEGMICFQVPVDEDELVLVYATPGSNPWDNRHLSLDYPGITAPTIVPPIIVAAPTPTTTATPTPTTASDPNATVATTLTPVPEPEPTSPPVAASRTISEMVEMVRPSVVRIHTDMEAGSGVIFEVDGDAALILTNYHVIEGATDIQIEVNDSSTYGASILGADPMRDLAVLRICCDDFRALSFGKVSELRPGDEILVMGYPLELPGGATVTRGIVSAIRFNERYQSLVIQTDAAINPGNSGGPMLSVMGELLGINTFRREETQSGRPVDNVGFAIAAPTIQEQMDILKTSPPPPPTEIPSPTPTQPPTPAPTPRPTPVGGYQFGALSGMLRHDPSDDFIKAEFADVALDDLMVEATFTNPYDASEHPWDYGFFLRYDRAEVDPRFLQVIIDGGSRWAVMSGSNNMYNQVAGGFVPNLNLGNEQQNHVMVVALEQRGWLFVNQTFVGSFDLSNVAINGDVAIATGSYPGGERAGASTRYDNFRGYDLHRRYGPTSATIGYGEKFVGTHRSGLHARDLVAEAEFTNPSVGASPSEGRWDYGFLIRRPSPGHLDIVPVHSSGQWEHLNRSVGDNRYAELGMGRLANWREGSLERNHLLLIAMGTRGWLFVNGQMETALDLSRNTEFGGVAAMAGFYSDSNQNVDFRNFTVWTP